MTPLLEVLKQAIVVGDADRAAELSERCLAEGTPAQVLFEQAVIAGIQETGRLWDANHYYVPDVILSADAFRSATRVVEQHLGRRAGEQRGKVVIGVVEGDVHDLGKGIVVAMLLGTGFEVIDLGVDLPIERFVEAVRAERPDILGVGAYMSTTMLLARDVIDALEEAGLRQTVKVMVGGVPTTQHFADEIAADGWAPDATTAARRALELLGRG
ncbi:MAG: corrinoid protein [Anaerolineae bacterium]|jgi:corrinoid protein of di/trimethylamine methyltransferase|nr:corrinoid protein [Anaerolineae bacterium]